MWDVIIILLIVALSALVQGLLGFGFGIVAISLAPLVIGFGNSVSLMAILVAVAMFFLVLQTRREFSWRDTKSLLFGALAGIPCGVLLIVVLDETIMLRCFGMLMLLISAHYFLFSRKSGSEIPDALALPIGFSSGILTGAFNMGGPPMIAYLYSKPWPVDKIKSVMASAYMIISLFRTPFIGLTSDDLGLVLTLTALSVAPIGLFITVGVRLAHRIPVVILKSVVYLYLALMGCFYLFLI